MRSIVQEADYMFAKIQRIDKIYKSTKGVKKPHKMREYILLSMPRTKKEVDNLTVSCSVCFNSVPHGKNIIEGKRSQIVCAHIVPRSHGGKPIPENIILICSSCNSSYKNTNHWEYLYNINRMKDIPADWRNVLTFYFDNRIKATRIASNYNRSKHVEYMLNPYKNLKHRLHLVMCYTTSLFSQDILDFFYDYMFKPSDVSKMDDCLLIEDNSKIREVRNKKKWCTLF